MNEIDLTKILKPGMKVYSLLDGEVEIESINSKHAFPIIAGNEHYTKEGTRYYNRGECILFPSKECRNWEDKEVLFILNPPKEGDYLVTRDFHTEDKDRVFIYNGAYRHDDDHIIAGAYAGIDTKNTLCRNNTYCWTSHTYRYATEEEIEEFNNRLYKEAGYIFNKETNKLDFQGRAKRGGTYYYIHYNGKIEQNSDDRLNYDDKLYHLGNYFLTREEAENCLEKLKRVYQECKRWT